jgi:AraC-like DNA-binding protein
MLHSVTSRRSFRLLTLYVDATIAPLLHLPRPQRPQLLRVTSALEKNPADRRTLEQWSTVAGMTSRRGARRASVTAAAYEVGYEDVSAFIDAFKSALGETPARYFKRT